MKKLLLTVFLGLAATFAYADNAFEYFTLELPNGEKVSYRLDGLKFTFSETAIIVHTDGVTQNFPVNDVQSLYYTASDLTAIESAPLLDKGNISVYTTDGRLVAKGKDAKHGLTPGIYIVKAVNHTYKISVR